MIVNESEKYTICKRIGPNRLLRDTSFRNIGLRYNQLIIMNSAFTNKKHRVSVTLYNKLIVIARGVCRISQGGGPNFKISGILDIHAAKRHVASSEAASLC